MLRGDDAGAGLVDLTDAVTVFVSTVGAPTFTDCMARLAVQDCRFQLQVIERVAPMNAAFQRMLDDCATPYFVQVDEDMLLEPHAIRTLYERMAALPERTAMFVGTLYDTHLRRCILGVKIFRHAIVRRYPFAAVDHFESDQVERFERDGYTAVRVPVGIEPVPGDTLGLHGTAWTPSQIYERYRKLECRRLTVAKTQWFAVYGPEFLVRFQRQPTEENFFALMGIVAGVLTSRADFVPAKDFRTYDRLPGFAALRDFLAAFPGALLETDESTETRGDGAAPGDRAS